ncbi:YtzI protein [Bacillus sp. FJAT-22090]|uniref:YtzI protein n=1 Tax=Bacillus sp. FJAT-22090 TaxID=1581038 RepID=UPI0011A8BED9|nr:YtzI protein [Bacillus sp. FJAT-22090]
MTAVFIIGAFTFIIVLGLTIFTINKGYAFKHTIDERPSNFNESNEKTHRQNG